MLKKCKRQEIAAVEERIEQLLFCIATKFVFYIFYIELNSSVGKMNLFPNLNSG